MEKSSLPHLRADWQWKTKKGRPSLAVEHTEWLPHS